jgi:hypothetical protein
MAAGVDCNGSITAEQHGENVMLKCNVWGAVVGSTKAKILEAMEQAIAGNFVIRKFEEMGAPKILRSISEECQRGEAREVPAYSVEKMLAMSRCSAFTNATRRVSSGQDSLRSPARS